MVKVKESLSRQADGSIDIEQWIQQLSNRGYFQNLDLIRQACMLSQLAENEQATETGESCLQQGLTMADILADLEVDQETVAAAITFESVHYGELSIDDVEEHLGLPLAKLVRGVEKMAALSSFYPRVGYPNTKHQMDNIRKMLLAMADDVRVVLIKLAERLCILRSSAPLPIAMRKQIATEAMEIYAPLANRLGIGAIKWEMEDLAFRFLHPVEYKEIAAGLKEKRLERERFVNLIVAKLNQELKAIGIDHFAVYGRAKHIHSIYRKMQRKNLPLSEIYDAIAVRILVDSKEQCYEALGLVHVLWQQIPKEFDDYIVSSKTNGYQSLHTAVKGPEKHSFEVQIRTFQMHALAEMGVAAHWRYKEGIPTRKESYERKIEWLREVLAWHREMAVQQGGAHAMDAEFLDDRVYVFTPEGDVLDLPQGVTVLDFAYHVHTELGHRCRGAKVNHHIVPLTYQLNTGDRIEVLTGKESKPSRDWINPHLNYLKTSRAKAKVLHWFKQQDFDKNRVWGQELLEKELSALGIKADRLQNIAEWLHYKTLDDLFAALGRGDLKVSQVLARLSPEPQPTGWKPVIPKFVEKRDPGGHDLQIEGVGNLLSHMARCCQPLPGDLVIGYITLGQGVSIHRQDCQNILSASEKQKQRFLGVSWTHLQREKYWVDILIKAYERPDLLKDISSLLAAEKMNIAKIESTSHPQDNAEWVDISIEVDSLNSLSRILARLLQIPNVWEARRKL